MGNEVHTIKVTVMDIVVKVAQKNCFDCKNRWGNKWDKTEVKDMA